MCKNINENFSLLFRGNYHFLPLSKYECKDFIAHICQCHLISSIQFEIIICDDKQSRFLNTKYLHSLSSTNVLSFQRNNETINQDRKKQIHTFIGSLVISCETLEREAFLYGQEKREYTKQLIVHGFAHLLGYEHGQKMDFFCASVLDS